MRGEEKLEGIYDSGQKEKGRGWWINKISYCLHYNINVAIKHSLKLRKQSDSKLHVIKKSLNNSLYKKLLPQTFREKGPYLQKNIKKSMYY